MFIRKTTILLLAVVVISASASSSLGQTNQGGEKNEETLSNRQVTISLRYKRFEKTLLQMAEYMRKTDPARAELLIRAISRSKEDRIVQQMEQLVPLLESQQFGDAVGRQEELIVYLRTLLQLLQSEDRLSEIEKEKLRIKDLLKDLGRLIGREKDVRVATERGENAAKLSDRQKKIADDAKKLVEKIDKQDANRDSRDQTAEEQEQESDKKDSEQGESEGKPSENGKSKPGKPSEGKPSEDEPSEGEPSAGKPSESEGKPSDEKSSSPSQPGQDESQESKKTPGRDDVEQARKDLEKAIEELKKQQHRAASEHQDEALEKLQKAKEKLEEILRQLREEERELLLAALEARFRRMLEMQLLVYNSTTSLDKTPREEWNSRHFSRSRDLAGQEDEIALEAAKALTLLREEGSSVAFPETVDQIHEDMQTVARRLERTEVGDLTQSIQQDIIEALEEMIEALQREMEKNDQKSQQQKQQEGQPQDQALINSLAELKMLRSLQLRVNRRTVRIGDTLEGEQATDPDLVDQLQSLSRRQSRIQRATYDLATGRNR